MVVALWFASGFYRVQPDEQGIVLRFGAYKYWTPPGLHWHIPWPVEEVELPAVTRINRTEIGFRSSAGGRVEAGTDTAGRDVLAESLMLTGDENIIDIDFVVFWRIRPNEASKFLFNARRPADLVFGVAESSMREVIGRTPIQPALTQLRAQIESDVMHQTQEILDRYNVGIEVTQVQLQKVDPPAAVVESFRDVQRANTDAERMRNEAESYHNDIVPRARGEAARLHGRGAGRQTGHDRRGDRPVAALRRRAARRISRPRTSRCAGCIWTRCKTVLTHAQDAGGGRQVEGPGAVPAAERAADAPAAPPPLPSPPGPSAVGQPQREAGTMNRLTLPLIGLLVVVVWLVQASLFTVEQTERVLVVQFGEVVRSIDDPGLYMKIPLIQSVISFDKRLLAVELPGEEVILGDQRRLIVDSFTVFRITDPLRFYQAIGPDPDGIRARLNSIVTASLRRCWAATRCSTCCRRIGSGSWPRSSNW